MGNWKLKSESDVDRVWAEYDVHGNELNTLVQQIDSTGKAVDSPRWSPPRLRWTPTLSAWAFAGGLTGGAIVTLLSELIVHH